jgi:tetratricopeptide (TPR) repeat protein
VLWQRGLRLAGVALANDPGSVGMHLNLASFLAVLGDRTAAAKEEAAALARAEEADLNPWELRHLAIAYAHVGDPSRAMEVLRYALRRGRLFGRPWLMAPGLERADGFADLAREYHDATERRRRLYSPAT